MSRARQDHFARITSARSRFDLLFRLKDARDLARRGVIRCTGITDQGMGQIEHSYEPCQGHTMREVARHHGAR